MIIFLSEVGGTKSEVGGPKFKMCKIGAISFLYEKAALL